MKKVIIVFILAVIAAGSAFAQSGDWTKLGPKELPPDGTWVAKYSSSVTEGINMSFLHTFVLKGKKVTSNKMKQTFSGANVNMIWPAFKKRYETPGLVPGTHRINDKEHSIETTYDPNDPIYGGNGNAKTNDYIYINTAKNRLRVAVPKMAEYFYIKQ